VTDAGAIYMFGNKVVQDPSAVITSSSGSIALRANNALALNSISAPNIACQGGTITLAGTATGANVVLTATKGDITGSGSITATAGVGLSAAGSIGSSADLLDVSPGSSGSHSLAMSAGGDVYVHEHGTANAGNPVSVTLGVKPEGVSIPSPAISVSAGVSSSGSFDSRRGRQHLRRDPSAGGNASITVNGAVDGLYSLYVGDALDLQVLGEGIPARPFNPAAP